MFKVHGYTRPIHVHSQVSFFLLPGRVWNPHLDTRPNVHTRDFIRIALQWWETIINVQGTLVLPALYMCIHKCLFLLLARAWDPHVDTRPNLHTRDFIRISLWWQRSNKCSRSLGIHVLTQGMLFPVQEWNSFYLSGKKLDYPSLQGFSQTRMWNILKATIDTTPTQIGLLLTAPRIVDLLLKLDSGRRPCVHR